MQWHKVIYEAMHESMYIYTYKYYSYPQFSHEVSSISTTDQSAHNIVQFMLPYIPDGIVSLCVAKKFSEYLGKYIPWDYRCQAFMPRQARDFT